MRHFSRLLVGYFVQLVESVSFELADDKKVCWSFALEPALFVKDESDDERTKGDMRWGPRTSFLIR